MSIPYHPLADIFPLMEGAEFDELVADIKANGLRNEIVLFDDMILDGRNRYRACLAAGWEELAIANMSLDGDSWIDDPAAYVISANAHRRHLTAEQKRDLIAKLVKAAPEKSDRQIAKTVKASPTTVGSVRSEMEARGEVSKLDTRIDRKGVKQPAKKPKPANTVSEGARMAPTTGTQPDKKSDPARDGATTSAQVERLEARLTELHAEKRQLEIKIVGLESEVEELRRENAELRRQLEATRVAEPLAGNDPGPMPEFLRREAIAS
jgi:ParB-like chromosome segregation protein Spo0J